MSTIASLISQIDPSAIRPWAQGMQEVNREQLGRQQAQTGLIELARLKQSQASEEEVMAFYRQHPELLVGGGMPQSILGSLQTAPGGPPPGGAPMTQQSLMPGQPPGAPQVVPGGQDLSRFATQGAPTPTLATIGPQGGMPGPPQGQQNPLVEMARHDPRAALLLQQQMQGQEDTQLKRQEQRLKMSTTILDSLGRRAQGATDQASWDLFRQDAASIDPRMAAQLPQVYSKEARDRVVAQALDVKETMTQRLEARKLDVLLRGQDVELAKAQHTGGKVNYQTDAHGNIVVVPEYAPGGGPVQSRPVLGADGQPIKSLEGQKLTTQQQEQVRTTETGLRTQLQARMAPFYEVRDAIGRIEQSATEPTATGDLALITSFMKMIDPTTGVKDAEFRNAAGAGGILDRVQGYIGKLQAGTRLDDDVRADFLQRSRMLFEQYGKDYGQVRQQFRDLTSRMGGKPENVDLDMGSTVAKPPGGRTGAGGQSAQTFTDADIAATLANPANKGKTRQQVIDAALAKGLVYKER